MNTDVCPNCGCELSIKMPEFFDDLVFDSLTECAKENAELREHIKELELELLDEKNNLYL